MHIVSKSTSTRAPNKTKTRSKTKMGSIDNKVGTYKLIKNLDMYRFHVCCHWLLVYERWFASLYLLVMLSKKLKTRETFNFYLKETEFINSLKLKDKPVAIFIK